MGADEAIALVSYLLQKHRSNIRLNDLQLTVFRQCYSGESYRDISDACGYQLDYVKQIGSQLWQLLSQVTGEKVSKSNLQAVLLRYQHEKQVIVSTSGHSPVCNWGEAVDVSVFFERTAELQTLRRWIQTDRCRLITLLGMGGIGKTALSVKLAEEFAEYGCQNVEEFGKQNLASQNSTTQKITLKGDLESPSSIAAPFQFILWKSLRDAPALEELLTGVIKFLSPQETQLPDSTGGKLARLIECLQQHRCLIVLDNFDALFKAGQIGSYRVGYENYGELLRRIGEVRHQSCLVLTSREKPQEVIAAEGDSFAVRVLHLHGLQAAGGQALLQAKGLTSSLGLLQNLVDCYRGNPLALKIAATSIQDLFTGDVTAFLQQKTYTFQGIEQLLNQHIERLSPLELQIMYWLAINRESVSITELQADLMTQTPTAELSKTLELLRSRSLIERTADGFTQQPVIMEYITGRIIELAVQEIGQSKLNCTVQNSPSNVLSWLDSSEAVLYPQVSKTPDSFLQNYTLVKATAKDYIRNSQIRMILQPAVSRLIERLGSAVALSEQLFNLLADWQTHFDQVPGYVAGNILNLFRYLQTDLTGADFSHCQIWQAYLSDVNLNHVNFAHAEVTRCIFAETFGGILSVSFSPDGERLAIADSNGEVRIWELASGQSLLAFKAHDAWIWSIAFSPDGSLLASASDDNMVKLWNPQTGQIIHTIPAHTHSVLSVAFTPDGQYLASSSDDRTIRLWQIGETICEYQTWHETHDCRVWSLAFSPDGKTLASSSEDGTVKLWQVKTGERLQTLIGHTRWIRGIAFHPTENIIASGSHDTNIKLWDTYTGMCLQTLTGHQDAVTAVAFSPDGQSLISSSHDQTARVWNVEMGECVQILQGHTNRLWSVAFAPNHSPKSQQVVSGGDDHAAKLWDLKSGRCIKTFQGYANSIAPIAVTKDGATLASGHEDETVKLWNIQTGNVIRTLRGHTDRVWSMVFAPAHVDEALLISGSGDQSIKVWNWQTGDCLKTLHGHQSWVWSLCFHPIEPILISSSYDGTIKLWDVSTGECLQTLTGHEASVTCVAVSPDGEWLASCGFDQTIRLWHFQNRECVHVWREHSNTVWQVAFSPNGQSLASCSYDQTVKVWNIEDETCTGTLEGHTAPIVAVIWSPNGKTIFSSGFDQTIRQWDVETGECLQTLQGHHGLVSWLNFTDVLISASFDETIRFWHPKTGQCLTVFRTPRPYEGLNVSGVKGLTEAQRSILIALGANEQEQPAVSFRQSRRIRSAVG